MPKQPVTCFCGFSRQFESKASATIDASCQASTAGLTRTSLFQLLTVAHKQVSFFSHCILLLSKQTPAACLHSNWPGTSIWHTADHTVHKLIYFNHTKNQLQQQQHSGKPRPRFPLSRQLRCEYARVESLRTVLPSVLRSLGDACPRALQQAAPHFQCF